MTDPNAHYVRPTSAASIPHSLVFVDCESTSRPSGREGETVQSFRLGVAIGVRRSKGQWVNRDILRFSDTFDFWEWFVSRVGPKQPVWLFSHNLSCDASWLDVWARVDDGTLKLNVPCSTCGGYRKKDCPKHHPFRGAAVVSDPPVILSFRCSRGVVKMVDTLNYWKASIAKLGKGVGLPKHPKPDPDCTDNRWFEYCERDVEIIERAVCGLMDEWERDQCGHFASTAAGLAWAAFRKTVEPKQILVNHDEPQTSLERAAYYGGQAEAFYVGRVDEPVALYDVRSLYPHVMHSSYFPVQFVEMGTDLRPEKVLQRMMFDCAIARIVIRTDDAPYPFRVKGGIRPRSFGDDGTPDKQVVYDPDRLAFPTGRYGTALAGPELARAIQRGHCEEILSVAWYRSAKIFGRFVDEWFAKRPSKISPENYCRDLLCKTVLNSMSGYFAKHKMRWKDRPELRPLTRWGEWWGIHAQTGKVTKYRGVGGAVQELEETGESRDSFPAIAAYITSYGREMMLWLRERCPARSIFYQDTDSLICNGAAAWALDKAGLIGRGELGRLRWVSDLPGLIINAVKDYSYIGRRVAAGVKEDATRIKKGKYKQEAWESIADQWSRTPDGTVRVRDELVCLSRTRVPRPRGPDGWTSAPVVDTKTEVPF